MFTLKDGSTSSDKRLTRIVQFDDKSRDYPIRALISDEATPRSYTWRCDAWLDQGMEGACVGFSLSHELIARPSVVQVDGTFAREKVYWEAQKKDPWAGGAYPGASPFYEGTSVLAGVEVLRKMGYIQEYRWAFGLEDLVMAVGHKGPAVLGVPWYDTMFEPHGCGYLHIGNGTAAGGHAILCKGVNVKKEYFTLHNSWGKSWGNNGSCKISWADMDRLLNEQGEAVIPLTRSKLV